MNDNKPTAQKLSLSEVTELLERQGYKMSSDEHKTEGSKQIGPVEIGLTNYHSATYWGVIVSADGLAVAEGAIMIASAGDTSLGGVVDLTRQALGKFVRRQEAVTRTARAELRKLDAIAAKAGV